MYEPLFIREKSTGDSMPFCQMVKAGDYLFISGQTARDETGNLVAPGDIQAQARMIFANLRRILSLAGCDLNSIVRLHTYLATPTDDAEATQRYWEVRREVFGNHRPASTGLWVAALGSPTPGMVIEVDAVAYAPNVIIDPDAQILNAPPR